ncbi:hypothetical protein AbraIFM66950_009309 [Aspergillus brasiliensis]|nr:hypothetical protein AbraIFM66950_009309 [Aspergillus brasiliensis]
MSQLIASPSQELEFKSFQDWNGDRPSQTLIVRDNSSIWWTRVEISWSLPESIRRLGYYQRPSVFQQFIKAIDFGQLHLLDDTVTLITLTLDEPSNERIPIRNIQDNSQTTEMNFYLSIAHQISFQIEEDPQRVTYPTPNRALGLPTFEGSDLKDNDSLLPRWALQIGRALEILHTQQRTHLDIKPSNIVLDAAKNAIVIDISGTGGYTWEWLSPEMQNTIQEGTETPPAETSFSERVATDCWAYGRVLSMMARKTATRSLSEWLQSIRDDLMKTDLKDRISLSDALKRIQDQE